jgi:hypothetical protein
LEKQLRRTSVAGSTRSVRVYWKWLGSVVLIALLLGSSYAHAADDHPLRPTDTSSPRATLRDFVEITDDSPARCPFSMRTMSISVFGSLHRFDGCRAIASRSGAVRPYSLPAQ